MKKKQVYKENYVEPRKLCKNSMFVLYLDNQLTQLLNRVSQIKVSSIRLLRLMPKNINSLATDFEVDISNYYGSYLPEIHKFSQEVRL